MSGSSSNDDLPPKKPRKDGNGLQELPIRLEKLHITPPAKTWPWPALCTRAAPIMEFQECPLNACYVT